MNYIVHIHQAFLQLCVQMINSAYTTTHHSSRCEVRNIRCWYIHRHINKFALVFNIRKNHNNSGRGHYNLQLPLYPSLRSGQLDCCGKSIQRIFPLPASSLSSSLHIPLRILESPTSFSIAPKFHTPPINLIHHHIKIVNITQPAQPMPLSFVKLACILVR